MGKITTPYNYINDQKLFYTCQLSRLRRESQACGLKTSISRWLMLAVFHDVHTTCVHIVSENCASLDGRKVMMYASHAGQS